MRPSDQTAWMGGLVWTSITRSNGLDRANDVRSRFGSDSGRRASASAMIGGSPVQAAAGGRGYRTDDFLLFSSLLSRPYKIKWLAIAFSTS